MSCERVLLADDEPLSREFLTEALGALRFEVTAVEDGDAALEALARESFDCVFTDLVMPGADGIAVVARSKQQDPDRPVILVTAHGTMGVAIEVLRSGADDILEKPVTVEDIELAVLRLRERARLRRENRFFRARSVGEQLLVLSPAMQRVLDVVERVARSKATVLIRGESGTGKERIAAEVHRRSDRAERPFVKINCAAIPESLMESELFGHEAGAFTGASQRRAGCFEMADGGTLFLDEIAEMSPALQAKLLRVLQEGEFLRVGGNRTVCVDVRIVAASNRDLQAEVESGRFREDLFYRLNVVPVWVPPLRERRDEILPLAEHFLSRGTEIAADAARLLESHSWPGNVRELQNVVQRACLLCEASVVDRELLEPWIGVGEAPDVPAPDRRDNGVSSLVGRSLRQIENELIRATLAECGGNRTKAARLLGIGVRTLFNRLKSMQPTA